MKSSQHPRIIPPTVLRALSHKAIDVPTIVLTESVTEALQRISDLNVEALAVMDGERLVGVFSERGFVRFMLNGGSLTQPVSAAMSAFPLVAAPDDDVELWLEQTAAQGIDHLPVVDGNRLLGLLFRADLLAESVTYHQSVYNAIDLDQRLMFMQGVYSC